MKTAYYWCYSALLLLCTSLLLSSCGNSSQPSQTSNQELVEKQDTSLPKKYYTVSYTPWQDTLTHPYAYTELIQDSCDTIIRGTIVKTSENGEQVAWVGGSAFIEGDGTDDESIYFSFRSSNPCSEKGRRADHTVHVYGYSHSNPDKAPGRGILIAKKFCECDPDKSRDMIAVSLDTIIHFMGERDEYVLGMVIVPEPGQAACGFPGEMTKGGAHEIMTQAHVDSLESLQGEVFFPSEGSSWPLFSNGHHVGHFVIKKEQETEQETEEKQE